jgi:hypothetical protein
VELKNPKYKFQGPVTEFREPMYRQGILLLIVISFALSSCLFVKAPEQKLVGETQQLSPLPEIEMSDELIRTREGDMIALVPRGWLLIDPKDDVSDDIITVAVNPEYTLCAVFSSIPATASSQEQLDREGLLGLARIAYTKHSRKSAGSVSLAGTYSIAELGTRRFGLYDFSSQSGVLRSRCAVFTSTMGNHYQFALVPINVSPSSEIVSDSLQQKIFRSILATIQY